MSGSARTRQGAAAAREPTARYMLRHKVRFVTATSLFDGHDASINVIRRVLQAAGAEVIHLGHNRSVAEIVAAAVQEDAHAVALSSYQGGHIEFFEYLIDLLREQGAGHIRVFGGGGGVIVPDEIKALESYGVTRIYDASQGQIMGLTGMVDDMLERADYDLSALRSPTLDEVAGGKAVHLARLISLIEDGSVAAGLLAGIETRAAARRVPVLGVTGTGGAGKSSLVDELVLRFRRDRPDGKVAVLAVDPSRLKGGGALLGDRIRMNAVEGPNTFMRSMATRDAKGEISAALPGAISACKAAGFDFVIVETSGIGQADAGIVPLVDLSLYVMTPEFGAASQLEKINMLDVADFVAINKFDRMGAEDALRDVRKQVQRNKETFDTKPEDQPVYGTNAAHFNDAGVTSLYNGLTAALGQRGFDVPRSTLPGAAAHTPEPDPPESQTFALPPKAQRYLADVADTVRAYHAHGFKQARIAREREQLAETLRMLRENGDDSGAVEKLMVEHDAALEPRSRELLDGWPTLRDRYLADEYVTQRDDRTISTPLTFTTLSGTRLPRVAVPRFGGQGTILRWLWREHLPGYFPFTAGVFPFKRLDEEPTRMFAGEGEPARTNARFKYLSKDSRAKRLSTAFDSVTLYGRDPDRRPDIYGKVGNAGVSIATLDDMKVLYDGFDLCDPATSVSMTINGPAPTILAMYLNTAIDQRMARFEADEGRPPTKAEAVDLRDWVHRHVRGTVQADILKEDQGQNTCLFSTEFSLRAMGDIQEYFIEHGVFNFYSVSISGYHIAEAGANPITQIALTLANGFTYVEFYLARGMAIDDFAPNLSFFFSAGMEPEYSVLGRVARRIWAVAMRDRYGASERSQKLKYHIQTSGRSLHAQEMAFNDIRTTLQGLSATYDHANSLHTNAYDEAVTTPTEESVRRALAIQMIINREWGLAKNENPNQGSFIIEELTDLVEEAVLKEFERLSARGGVLGAMETGYQRGKIQEESLHYETVKHSGELPIVGVNTYQDPGGEPGAGPIALQRSSEEEKDGQIRRLGEFQARHAGEAPAMLARLKATAISGENLFAALVEAVRVCSLGQITDALFEVGGKYRRNM
ncbi:MAG: cobalamin-dependent protein [Proteobacteria bacterium]|nr:cobalamin-dependent protein [Pseudomonadota bacterium]